MLIIPTDNVAKLEKVGAKICLVDFFVERGQKLGWPKQAPIIATLCLGV